MAKFMRLLNNISRSQAIFRHNHISQDDLQPSHYSFVLAVCHKPGCSQEDIAKRLCLNKSTVARGLTYLEQHGYVTRTALPNDKRQFSVHPTEKMLEVYPGIKDASEKWMLMLSQGISKEDLDVFDSVLSRMEIRAREIIQTQEDEK